jgi:hypothetical protein
MTIKTFTSGRIRQADFDPATNQLDLHWADKKVLAYKQVPEQVFRRLCAAPTRRHAGRTASRTSTPRACPRLPALHPMRRRSSATCSGAGIEHRPDAAQLMGRCREHEERYQRSAAQGDNFGVFLTDDGARVRHHSAEWLDELFAGFQKLDARDVKAVTMNRHRSGCCQWVLRKP